MARSARSRRRVGTAERACCQVWPSRHVTLESTDALAGKKAARIDDPSFAAENEANGDDEEGDSRDVTEVENESFTETNAATGEQDDVVAHSSSLNDGSRAAFDFRVDAPTVDDLPGYESLDRHQTMEQAIDSRPTEDAALTSLFHSPIKYISTAAMLSPEKVDYPNLPHSDDSQADFPATTSEKYENVIEKAIVQDSISMAMETQNISLHSEATPHIEKSEAEHLQSPARIERNETLAQIEYPTLPSDEVQILRAQDQGMDEDEDENADLSEVEIAMESHITTRDDNCSEEGTTSYRGVKEPEEDFTEATLQLDIMRDCQEALQKHEQAITPKADNLENGQSVGPTEKAFPEEDDMEMTDAPDTASVQDITDGLTLSFASAQSQSLNPIPRKLHSPPPPLRLESGPDDATMTVAFDDDTAVLKDFLNRAAASKAEKAAITTHRRESLQNRRDSDVVRHALASPRKVLEEKDPNSPSKHDNELTLDLSQNLTLSMPAASLPSPTPGVVESEEDAEEKSAQSSRRSSRTKRSRLPAPASTGPAPAPKIAIRRADGNEVVVLKKDDAKVLADLTRTNTRKNKQGAFGVTLRLMKLMMEASGLPPIDDTTKELIIGKNVRWDEQLAYYQENPETVANALAEAESLATPDELSMADGVSAPKKKKVKTSKESTPKVRRVRGLGSANGTPGKGLLAPASLLPETVQGEKESVTASSQQSANPKAGKVKKMSVASTSIDSSLSSSSADTKLPSLDVTPVGVAPTMQRKSRLAAPKKVILPQLSSSAPGEGKENAQRSTLSDPTPKKGMESGLPRRKGRKY